MPKRCVLHKRLIQIRRTKGKIDTDFKYFNFKEIGNLIENLLDNLFRHSFSKSYFSLNQANKKPRETVIF